MKSHLGSWKIGIQILLTLASTAPLKGAPLDNWHLRTAPTSHTLYAVTYGSGLFVAVGQDRVGEGGAILQSDPLPTAQLVAGPLSDQGFALTISGEAGLSYRLQASESLPSTNWSDLLTFMNSGPATNFVDTSATNFDRRFYRVMSP